MVPAPLKQRSPGATRPASGGSSLEQRPGDRIGRLRPVRALQGRAVCGVRDRACQLTDSSGRGDDAVRRLPGLRQRRLVLVPPRLQRGRGREVARQGGDERHQAGECLRLYHEILDTDRLTLRSVALAL